MKLHIVIDLRGFEPIARLLAAPVRRFVLWLRTPRTPTAPSDLILSHALRLAEKERTHA